MSHNNRRPGQQSQHQQQQQRDHKSRRKRPTTLPAPSAHTKPTGAHKSLASTHSHVVKPIKSTATGATAATTATNATGRSAAMSVLSKSSGHHHQHGHRHHRPSGSKRHLGRKSSRSHRKPGQDGSRNQPASPRAKPIQIVDMHKSKDSAYGLAGLLRRVPEYLQKSVSKERKTEPRAPVVRHDQDYFKQHVLTAQSPSDLSFKSITEHYTLPEGEIKTNEDVFRHRGFKKLNKIDEGAFGVVSRAINMADKSLVAVKEVDLRRKRSKRIEEMKRELFVLQKVEHINVVRLIEHFTIDHTLVIIMEFCAGGNLTSYLKETAISENEAASLFKQMAASLKVLHRKGIAHRDVKLNNFLMDITRKNVKIADFGLSIVYFRPNTGIKMAKTYCGTEPYMAPELLKRNSLGARSYNALYADIWSLGICLFAMLTRTFPFKMQTSQRGLLRAQLNRRWRFPRKLRDSVSEEIKDLVAHMLDPEPDRRISINGVLAHPWINQNQVVVLSTED